MSSRARNKLNVKQVEHLKKIGVHSDGGGLYLRIRKSGRSWIFIGTVNGERFELGLGSALDVSLAKAREKATEVRQLALEGRDPRILRKRASEENAAQVSFGKFAKQYVADIESGFRNPKHRQQWRNTLETYGKPIAKVPIAEVDTDDVLRCVRPIWGKKQETASRVRGRIEKVLDAAKAKGLRTGENPARMRGHLEHLLPKRSKASVKHHAALPYAEMPTFMAALRKREGMAAKALEFTILTAARSGEVRGMTWGEVDLDAKLWSVPAVRMKASETHVVPLSEAAISVLQAVREEGLEGKDVVFAAPSGRSLSDMSLSAVLKRMGRDVTVHGMRSAFRDWAGDTTEFPRDVVEMALAHAVGSATERAYRRGRALDKRRELMTAWASYCDNQGA
ncbi:tyrosine-type recombinase/integrase [Erythrobacter vulgaris]|uniref:Tyrosine-type recombinase/integrase n=1 Tax=Qipengyuania vulgaris TaxID=291985 RepID=A0A844XTB9_9SPHN|nr:site-specific integrase [Qipengyuania vulgaris]MXO48649.1 tyrosine-type recombinase/integrase [Qipengyuania vulgaris]